MKANTVQNLVATFCDQFKKAENLVVSIDQNKTVVRVLVAKKIDGDFYVRSFCEFYYRDFKKQDDFFAALEKFLKGNFSCSRRIKIDFIVSWPWNKVFSGEEMVEAKFKRWQKSGFVKAKFLTLFANEDIRDYQVTSKNCDRGRIIWLAGKSSELKESLAWVRELGGKMNANFSVDPDLLALERMARSHYFQVLQEIDCNYGLKRESVAIGYLHVTEHSVLFLVIENGICHYRDAFHDENLQFVRSNILNKSLELINKFNTIKNQTMSKLIMSGSMIDKSLVDELRAELNMKVWIYINLADLKFDNDKLIPLFLSLENNFLLTVGMLFRGGQYDV